MQKDMPECKAQDSTERKFVYNRKFLTLICENCNKFAMFPMSQEASCETIWCKSCLSNALGCASKNETCDKCRCEIVANEAIYQEDETLCYDCFVSTFSAVKCCQCKKREKLLYVEETGDFGFLCKKCVQNLAGWFQD